MDVQELENAITVVKYVYPIISGGFIIIVSLLIYIWRSNTDRTDKILEKTNETLDELKTISAVQGNDIENLKGAVFRGKRV